MGLNDSRLAVIRLALDPRGLDVGLDDARRKLRQYEDDIVADERKRRRKRKGAGDVLSGMVAGFTSSATDAALGFVKDSAVAVMDAERALTRFQISSGKSATETAQFRDDLVKLSVASGINRQELIAGAAEYVTLTGDAKGAAKAMDVFSRVALASGASMADIAGTAASLRDNLGIDPSDFQGAFDVLITQGEAGSVEINNLARELAAVAPGFAKFKGAKTAKGVAELGAAFQVARKEFRSASETTTGLTQLFTAIDRSYDKIEAKGVQLLDAKKNKRTFTDIARQLTKLSDRELIDVLGSSEAARTVSALRTYKGLYDQLRTSAEGSDAVNRKAALFQESAAGRMDKAMNNLRESVSRALTPERIEAFAKVMERIVGLAGDLAMTMEKWFTGNSPIQRTLRELLGMETEDDRVFKMQAQTLQERIGKAKAMGAADPMKFIASEDIALAEQARGKVRGTDQDIGLSGLLLQREMGWEGFTNRALIEKANAEAIARVMVAKIQATWQPVVTIGNETVKTAVKDAKSGRNGAGGR